MSGREQDNGDKNNSKGRKIIQYSVSRLK